MATMVEYPAGISLCMIVRNEEAFLADALLSVAGSVDEICVVDTGSTDGTIAIARAHGARVVEVPWADDFAAARNAALTLATRRWIFVLDADERLHVDARAGLRAIGQRPVAGRGKWIKCRNLTDDFKGSGTMTNALVRLFPNDSRIRYRNAIHEFVTLDGAQGGLPSDITSLEIIHHGYLDEIVSARGKGERNLRLSRFAAQAHPEDPFHHYNLGMASLLAGQTEAAIRALDRCVELSRAAPRGFHAHALIVLAGLYAQARGNTNAALALLSECLAAVPTYSTAHFSQGKLLAGMGDLFAARDAFGRAIACGVHDREQFVVDDEIAIWKAHSEIGVTLMRESRYAEALAWFELATRARPDAQPLVLNRAKSHEALGELAMAETLFSGAFRGDRDASTATEWINFLLRRDRPADALGAIEIALRCVDTNCAVVLLGIAAAIALRAGEEGAARTAVERALSLADHGACAGVLLELAARIALPELGVLVNEAMPARAPLTRIGYTRSQ